MEEGNAGNEISAIILEWIEVVSIVIEMLAVGIIVVAVLYGTGRYLLQLAARPTQSRAYNQYKVRLGRALLLGLEILVAADIVRTVALDPSLESAAVLGLLVVIRTFLSWSLIVEIEGRWPWQAKETGAQPAETDM